VIVRHNISIVAFQGGARAKWLLETSRHHELRRKSPDLSRLMSALEFPIKGGSRQWPTNTIVLTRLPIIRNAIRIFDDAHDSTSPPRYHIGLRELQM
jgi:hypothetical protein